MGHSEAEGVQIVAILTARGGSKGLPRKNIRTLKGKPLIAYSIQAALNCPWINRCIVSTEDEEIKQVSLQWGAEVIDRPQELAADDTQSKDVVMHVLETLREQHALPQYFVLMQPTSPLRKADHLTDCITQFLNAEGASSIVSVTEFKHHPYKSFTISEEVLVPIFEQCLDMPRQQLPKVYMPNGAIYMTSSDLFLTQQSFYPSPCLPFEMTAEDSVDIDFLIDFTLAEKLLEKD